MTIGAVKSGAIVLCDRMGRRFYAVVVERHERELEVDPIDRRVTYRRAKAREVLGIWRKSRQRSASCPAADPGAAAARNEVVA